MGAHQPSRFDRFRHWWRGAERKASLATPDAALFDLFGATPAASGVSVTPRTAMTCAPVRCAVLAISEAIGQLPVHVYKRGEDGSKERAPDHPAFALLHDSVCEWVSATAFREQMTADALLHDVGGVAYINRVNGKPMELQRLDPEAVTISHDKVTGEPIYTYAIGNERRVYSYADVLHIRGPFLESPIKHAKEAIGLAIVMERHAARLFGNGARPSGLISLKGTVKPETVTKARAAWQAAHGGSNSGGTAVLPTDAEWTPLTLNSVDAQFLEMRKFAIEDVARAFRVQPMRLMEYGRATWSNSEQAGREFIDFTLMPWIKRWEGEIRLKLFSLEERADYFAEFLTDDLARADLATRMDAYGKAIAARVLNPNEARAMDNRPPYEGGDRFENPNVTTGAAHGNV